MQHCDRCETGVMAAQGDDLVCLSCGYRLYDAAINAPSVKGGLPGNVHILRYLGKYEEMGNKTLIVEVSAVENRARAQVTPLCPFCAAPMADIGVANTRTGKGQGGLWNRKDVQRYRCADGHRISIAAGMAGWE